MLNLVEPSHVKNIGLTYRPAIDGLRAIAVLAVVLNHIGLAPGGFVGVDVFFVISGFLITSIIARECSAGEFSLAQFYCRRVRRIVPAIIPVLVASAVAALLLFIPSDLQAFGGSLAATGMFASNIWFMLNTSYFAPDAISQPLLHTWSLGVEEQFYLFFPLALLSMPRRWWGRLLSGIILASLALASYVSAVWPEAAFYLLPTRAWELAAGALLALAPLWREAQLKHVVALLGLVVLCVSLVAISEATPFPAFAVPAVAAALAVIACGEQTLVSRFLATYPLRLIGQASYSIYLWHWPLIVFFAYWRMDDLSLKDRLTIAVLSIIAGIVSLVLIERPVRQKSAIRLAPSLVALSCIAVATGAWFVQSGGLPDRLPLEARRIADVARERNQFFRHCMQPTVPCPIGDTSASPEFVLWGDSHAAAIAPAVSAAAAKYGIAGRAILTSSCPPLIGAPGWWKQTEEACHQANTGIAEYVAANHIRLVIMHASWTRALNAEYAAKVASKTPTLGNKPDEIFDEAISRTVGAITASGAKVAIVEGVPIADRDVVTMLTRAGLSGVTVHGPDVSTYARSNGRINEIFARQASRALIIKPASVLCGEAFCSIETDGAPIYFDRSHLSMAGAAVLESLFDELFAHSD